MTATVGGEAETLCPICASTLTPGAAFCARCGGTVVDRVVAPPPDGSVESPAEVESTPDEPVPESIWTGLMPVQPGIRILCFLLDMSVVTIAGSVTAVISLIVGIPQIATIIAPMVVVAIALWNLSWLVVSGKTFGKAALGVRAISARTTATPSVVSAAVRALMFTVCAGLMSVTILIDRTPWRRGWHDIASGIILVDALNGRNPLGPQPVASVLRKPDRGLRAVRAPIALPEESTPASPTNTSGDAALTGDRSAQPISAQH